MVGGWVGARKQVRQASSQVDSSGRGACAVMVQGRSNKRAAVMERAVPTKTEGIGAARRCAEGQQ